jgi:hypothetical protein
MGCLVEPEMFVVVQKVVESCTVVAGRIVDRLACPIGTKEKIVARTDLA